MKKPAYVIGGVLIGFVLATTTSAFADTVKSMIGKKVTGEYTVIVNGQKLSEKGAIIDGKANVPVRAISDSLGADIKVSGKTITVTTTESTDLSDGSVSIPPVNNKYAGYSKQALEEVKISIENNRIKPAVEEREHILKEIEELKKPDAFGQPAANLEMKQKQLAEYDEIIAKAKEDLRLVEEALAALK